MREHKFKRCSLVINKEIKIFCERNDYDYEPKDRERREVYAELRNILESDSFVDNLFEKYEWVKIIERGTSKEISLMLGTPLWFVNYMSFSNDNRYVGITGKYRDSSGVFFLFDITTGRLIYKHIDDNGISRILAVWTCAFTHNNIVGYYTSSPHCYLIDADAAEILPKRISDKSFLCFSPSGDFIALSNKGYIPYSSCKIGWGHQPSNDIYIHSVSNPEKELAHYKDHGDGIKGITSNNINCPRDVGMVSFSADNTKLLSVSYDGVVVIRNLKLRNSIFNQILDRASYRVLSREKMTQEELDTIQSATITEHPGESRTLDIITKDGASFSGDLSRVCSYSSGELDLSKVTIYLTKLQKKKSRDDDILCIWFVE
jgi:hypothetical protein